TDPHCVPPPRNWVPPPRNRDDEVLARISELVREEDSLHEQAHRLDDAERDHLERLEVALGQCGDLLQQRRARSRSGLDPEGAQVCGADVVEGYQQ
ncbi:MAG: DUF2630 family protein, partial [Pseudonocardiaceae bacterium]